MSSSKPGHSHLPSLISGGKSRLAPSSTFEERCNLMVDAKGPFDVQVPVTSTATYQVACELYKGARPVPT